MWSRVRHAAVYVFAAALVSSGLAYASTGSMNPVKAVVEAAGDMSELGAAAEPATLQTQVDPLGDSEVTDTDGDGTGSSPTTPTGTSPTTPTSHGVERSTEGCPEGFSGTHGQFVSSSEDKQAAAHSPCGKPIQSVEKKHDGQDDTELESKKAKPAKQKNEGSDAAKDHKRQGKPDAGS